MRFLLLICVILMLMSSLRFLSFLYFYIHVQLKKMLFLTRVSFLTAMYLNI